MGKRAAALLASPVLLGLCGALTACVPPAPLSVSGTLPPPSSTFTLIGDDSVAQAARAPLTAALATRGLRSVSEKSDRLVMVTLADRPRANGAAAGKALPDAPDAAQWVDRPTRDGLFAKGRREVRLTVIFFSADGRRLEERMVYGVVTRKAPAPDIARLIDRAVQP